MPLLALFTRSSTLSLNGVVHNLPHDAPAIVGYVLIAAFIGFVWQGNRKRPEKHPDTKV
ncbi:MAG: hypothetical protein PVH00_12370 [Gemmatimonadota bacterium]|jgi:hypothetical protein